MGINFFFAWLEMTSIFIKIITFMIWWYWFFCLFSPTYLLCICGVIMINQLMLDLLFKLFNDTIGVQEFNFQREWEISLDMLKIIWKNMILYVTLCELGIFQLFGLEKNRLSMTFHNKISFWPVSVKLYI